MNRRDLQTSGRRPDYSFATLERLSRENARLSAICAQQQERIAHQELLRREGDHRIKNNLQILASLLSIQALRETNAPLGIALAGAIARVHAIAHMHDAIQLNPDGSDLDLGAQMIVMCHALQELAGPAIKVAVRADPVLVPIAFAQSLLLAVNELVINALRHAFRNGSGGSVIVEVLTLDRDVQISVADDGVGYLANNTSPHGYGSTLVEAMIKKVGGRLDVQSKGGAKIVLRAPLPCFADTVSIPQMRRC
jgi:two-component sensor histidine kinase